VVNSSFSLTGKSALVTGGASGIGEASCRALRGAGATLVIADVDAPKAEALAQELGQSQVVIMDITDETAIKNGLATVPHLDILVNNAGIGAVGNIEETQLEEMQRLLRVNVEGLFLVTKHCIPLLKKSRPGPGKIINIGSVAGLIGVKRRFAYCATKGAVIAMTRQLAVDYPSELRANCICPGTVETPFVDAYLHKYHPGEEEQTRTELHKRQPVGRMGRPEEVADLVLYLASPNSDFMHGSILPIDGGWTAG